MLKIAGYDLEAVEEIYDRYAPIMYTLIFRIVSDQKLAEEILKDVFLLFSKNIDKFDYRSNSVCTWLITLARNKAVDFIRQKRNPESVREDPEEFQDRYILPRLAENIQPINLEQILNDKERIVNAIDSLTDAQRFVLDLAFYDGLTEKEIAKKLNIPFQTVRSKIQIALGNLNEKLKSSG